MKRWLLAGALAFAAAGQGLASDLPPPALPAPPRAPAAYVPPVSPVYNWGGVYFGFNLGYGFGTSNWSDPLDPGGTTGNFNLRGFLAGATIGANFQADLFVFGAEADFDGSFIDGKHPARSSALGRSAKPKISGFPPPAPVWVMPLIAYYSMAQLAAHLVTLHQGKAATSSERPKVAGRPAPA